MVIPGYDLAMSKTSKNQVTLLQALDQCVAAKWAGSKAEDSSVQCATAAIALLGDSVLVSKVSRRLVLDTITRMREQKLAPATINRRLSALNVVLDYSRDMGWREDGALDGIMLKEPRGRLRIVSDTEYVDLIAAMRIDKRADEAELVVFLRGTGMRVSEALNLRWEDFIAPGELGSGPHGVVAIDTSKNGSSRHVPLSAQASVALLAVAGRGTDRTGPFSGISQSALNKAWRRAAKLMQITDKEFVPHALRHTRATELVSSGVPLAVVAKILGHKSIKSTMRYAHVSSAVTLEWLTRAGKLS